MLIFCEYVLTSGILLEHVANKLRNCPTGFQGGRTILYYYSSVPLHIPTISLLSLHQSHSVDVTEV